MHCIMLAVMLPMMFTELLRKPALTAIQLHGPVHQQWQPGTLLTMNSRLQ